MMSLATEVALVEMMMSGCTTASDHHYLIPTGLEHAIDLQVEVANKLAVRAIFTRGSMSLGEDEAACHRAIRFRPNKPSLMIAYG